VITLKRLHEHKDFFHQLKCLANDNISQAIQKRGLQKFWKKKALGKKLDFWLKVSCRKM